MKKVNTREEFLFSTILATECNEGHCEVYLTRGAFSAIAQKKKAKLIKVSPMCDAASTFA